MTLGENPSAKFWYPSKQPLDYKSINWRDSEVAVQVRLKSIWFQSNKSFGGCLEVEHVMVRERDLSCPFEDDAADDRAGWADAEQSVDATPPEEGE